MRSATSHNAQYGFYAIMSERPHTVTSWLLKNEHSECRARDRYYFKYPTGWKTDVINKVQKGTQVSIARAAAMLVRLARYLHTGAHIT